MSHPLNPPVTLLMEIASAASIAGWIGGLLPGLATVLGIVWYGLQIYESKFVQERMFKRRKIRKI